MTAIGGRPREIPPWRDYRRYPVTCGLGLIWILVYLGMCWDQGSLFGGGNLLSGGISIPAAHDFGSATPAEIRSGELWRSLTATCVHFGVLHIAMNLLVFSQIARIVEEWYGSSILLALYVVIGGPGNLLASWIKILRIGHQNDPSGGGSGVICGLIALAAVVGWRSRTEIGRLLSRGMLTALGTTAILGILVPQVDNVAHASGAILGALLGLFNDRLVRASRTASARWFGTLAIALLFGSAALQFLQTRAAYSEAAPRYQRGFGLLAELELLRMAIREETGARGGRYSSQGDRFKGFPFPAHEKGFRRKLIESMIRKLDPPNAARTFGPDAEAVERTFGLARLALTRRLTPGEFHAFDASLKRVAVRIQGDINENGRRLSSFRNLSRAPGRNLVLPRPKAP